MIEGRTFTKHFHVETRQHELFNLDLGEGVPRRMFVFGVGVVLVWIALLFPFLGAPTSTTFSFYAIPPVIFAYFAFQDSDRQPRRKNLTQWAVKVRYMISGHRPIVRLGRRAAFRTEYLPLGERIPFEGAVRKVAPWMLPPEWEREAQAEHADIQTGRAIKFDQTATLYGFDHMQQLRTRRKGKQA